MTALLLYILVAIPLVGILANTGLFIHSFAGRCPLFRTRRKERVRAMSGAPRRFGATPPEAARPLSNDTF